MEYATDSEQKEYEREKAIKDAYFWGIKTYGGRHKAVGSSLKYR